LRHSSLFYVMKEKLSANDAKNNDEKIASAIEREVGGCHADRPCQEDFQESTEVKQSVQCTTRKQHNADSLLRAAFSEPAPDFRKQRADDMLKAALQKTDLRLVQTIQRSLSMPPVQVPLSDLSSVPSCSQRGSRGRPSRTNSFQSLPHRTTGHGEYRRQSYQRRRQQLHPESWCSEISLSEQTTERDHLHYLQNMTEELHQKVLERDLKIAELLQMQEYKRNSK